MSAKARIAACFRAAVIVAMVALGASCESPSSVEQFVRIRAKGDDGLYHYTLDLSDSTARYDVSFYSRIDCNNLKISSLNDFLIAVTWISPSGRKYAESVNFAVHDISPGSDFYSHQYVIPYRSGLAPVEWGLWEMTLRVDSDSRIPGFRGMGVVCSKTP